MIASSSTANSCRKRSTTRAGAGRRRRQGHPSDCGGINLRVSGLGFGFGTRDSGFGSRDFTMEVDALASTCPISTPSRRSRDVALACARRHPGAFDPHLELVRLAIELLGEKPIALLAMKLVGHAANVVPRSSVDSSSKYPPPDSAASFDSPSSASECARSETRPRGWR